MYIYTSPYYYLHTECYYNIGGKKFDMRLYTLVTTFSPLKAYTYRRGFARFTNTRYSDDITGTMLMIIIIALNFVEVAVWL